MEAWPRKANGPVLVQLLRPLVKILLLNSIPYGTSCELAKCSYKGAADKIKEDVIVKAKGVVDSSGIRIAEVHGGN